MTIVAGTSLWTSTSDGVDGARSGFAAITGLHPAISATTAATLATILATRPAPSRAFGPRSVRFPRSTASMLAPESHHAQPHLRGGLRCGGA
jgi:hypothetical protein